MNDVLYHDEQPLVRPADQRKYLTADYITSLDFNSDSHVEGYVDALIEQAASHGHTITKEHARVVANSIGQDFEVTVLCGQLEGQFHAIKGITATASVDAAEGRVLFLEDIVVMPSVRKFGFGTQLLFNSLIDSWEQGYAGYAWETGRNNESARFLYLKVDPTFDTSNLHDVWRLSANRRATIAEILPRAHLGKPWDLNNISDTLTTQPDKDLGYISRILQQQEHNGFNAPSFIVASNSGALAITSVAYSTFEGSRRADTRLYMPSQVDPEDIEHLFRRVAAETVRRKWRGSMHVEFSNNVIQLDESVLRRERENVGIAQAVLRNLGGEALVHNDDNMVAYSLTGRRYIKAVMEALRKTPARQLPEESSRRLNIETARRGLSPVYAQPNYPHSVFASPDYPQLGHRHARVEGVEHS